MRDFSTLEVRILPRAEARAAYPGSDHLCLFIKWGKVSTYHLHAASVFLDMEKSWTDEVVIETVWKASMARLLIRRMGRRDSMGA